MRERRNQDLERKEILQRERFYLVTSIDMEKIGGLVEGIVQRERLDRERLNLPPTKKIKGIVLIIGEEERDA